MYPMKKMARNVVIMTVAACLVLSGCANKRSAGGGNQPSPSASDGTAHSANIRVSDETARSGVPVRRESNGQVWVPLQEAAEAMGFQLIVENDTLAMGETDANYTAKVNDVQAMLGDSPVTLPQAPRLIDGKPYMTTEALSAWIGTPVNWSDADSHVVITPADDASSASPLNAQNSPSPDAGMGDGFRSLAATVDKSAVLSYARRFMGTPYQFAAKPYTQTHKFDCSSFVQYVYGHFGVRLPRSSRSQSQVGRTVSVNQLQVGDLLFFYTPGRYSSNRVVGHVGIYAGNNKILHTYGHPGVTISDFSSYWHKRFLWAKRV